MLLMCTSTRHFANVRIVLTTLVVQIEQLVQFVFAYPDNNV